ncbi:TetR/AcrR family transcriptional regulator [Aureibaculum luteum]|uniref:TetR/AcrR family transcriptional regulator n=1 Tax=Aureibaculum luteum TaxID=1548456 RepID=UPI000E4D3853|nr:TetR/AcrR family transcriptional regulator [Aureibaculum luteum]
MLTKAELTKLHILKTVAPIFNQNGYAATSMSDITLATSLTKGAIYGHFENKEELAIAAFNYNVKSMLLRIGEHLSTNDSPIEKLYLITDFYRNYYNYSKELGGCPITNVGVDANNQNTALLERVRYVVRKIQDQIATLIEDGIKAGEINTEINAMTFAKRIDTMLQGAIFLTYTMDDDSYLKETTHHIDSIISNELKE